MAKKAIIVTFEARTRLIVDIPDGKELDDMIYDDFHIIDKMTEAAREQMIQNNLNDYLSADNLVWEYDIDCPPQDDDAANLTL